MEGYESSSNEVGSQGKLATGIATWCQLGKVCGYAGGCYALLLLGKAGEAMDPNLAIRDSALPATWEHSVRGLSERPGGGLSGH